MPIVHDYKDAIQLEVGNRWEFEVFKTDLNTGVTEKLENELIAIIDTTRSAGEKVFIMVGPHYGWERMIIDSSGYLIDFSSREVLFAAVDPGVTLFENGEITVSISAVDTVVHVPAGAFEAAVFKRASRHSNESSNHYYAHGVGLVKQVYISKDARYEHNLIEYRVIK